MDENILPLIHEVASQFQRSGPDVRLIQKAIQDIRDTETVRREIIDDARAQLQKLSREIQLSKSKASRKNVNPESLNHDTQMFELDRKKFAIAKTIQDLDQDNASLEAEISKLRMQSLELDSSYKSATATTNGISDEDGVSRNDHDDDALDDADDVLGDTAHAMAV
ncbi:hypothetical protein BGZ49_006345 [Haplosporangium sp. Z 27]|nr:hypothetical protein BGZ49_006345 [Haplosporangium sp. Z 27]